MHSLLGAGFQQALFPEMAETDDKRFKINELIRETLVFGKTGFTIADPGGRFALPQWPGFVWPYYSGARGERHESGSIRNQGWLCRIHGVHPEHLAKAGISPGQEELQVENPRPSALSGMLQRLSSVLPPFLIGGTAMAAAMGTNQWNVPNTYRLTVWTLLMAAASPLDQIKRGLVTPGGISEDDLLKVFLPVALAQKSLVLPAFERGTSVTTKDQRFQEAWGDFLGPNGFPSHWIFGKQFRPDYQDVALSIRSLEMVRRVSSFSDTDERRRNQRRKEAEVTLSPFGTAFAYSARVRLLDHLKDLGASPAEAILGFANWWVDLPVAEGRLLLHLLFSPGERPEEPELGGRRNFSYLKDENYFQMALGNGAAQDWKSRQKARERNLRLSGALLAILNKCPFHLMANRLTLAIEDFRVVPKVAQSSIQTPQVRGELEGGIEGNWGVVSKVETLASHNRDDNHIQTSQVRGELEGGFRGELGGGQAPEGNWGTLRGELEGARGELGGSPRGIGGWSSRTKSPVSSDTTPPNSSIVSNKKPASSFPGVRPLFAPEPSPLNTKQDEASGAGQATPQNPTHTLGAGRAGRASGEMESEVNAKSQAHPPIHDGKEKKLFPEEAVFRGVPGTVMNSGVEVSSAPMPYHQEPGKSPKGIKGVTCERFSLFERWGLVGGVHGDSLALQSLLGQISAYAGTSGVPVGPELVRRAVAATPWSPRGIWLFHQALIRTPRGLSRPKGVIERWLRGDVTGNDGSPLRLFQDFLDLGMVFAQQKWVKCPLGPASSEAISGVEPAPGVPPAFAPLPHDPFVTMRLDDPGFIQESLQRQEVQAAGQRARLLDELQQLPQLPLTPYLDQPVSPISSPTPPLPLPQLPALPGLPVMPTGFEPEADFVLNLDAAQYGPLDQAQKDEEDLVRFRAAVAASAIAFTVSFIESLRILASDPMGLTVTYCDGTPHYVHRNWGETLEKLGNTVIARTFKVQAPQW